MVYNPEQFDELAQEFLAKEAEILGFKRGEYASGEDRLLNFREVAALEGRTLEEVCMSWLLKHIQSINLAVKEGRAGNKWHWHDEQGNEGMKQRIVDARNYLLLLAGCIDEGPPPIQVKRGMKGENEA